MKNILLIAFVFTFSLLRAQIDSVPIGRVTYIQDIALFGDKSNNGYSVLLFNPSCSEYRQKPTRDSSVSNSDYVVANFSGDKDGFPIYKLHGAHKIFCKVTCRQSKNHCIVSDTFGDITWVLQPERKRFGQYEGRRATGTFRGRTYEAWYCLDIPIPSGPFKLGGLPGLILEAASTDGKVKFLFGSLEISGTLTDTIRMPSGKDINMSYTELINEQTEFNRNTEKKLKAQGHNIRVSFLETIEIPANK